jgi:hypothetical protein
MYIGTVAVSITVATGSKACYIFSLAQALESWVRIPLQA